MSTDRRQGSGPGGYQQRPQNQGGTQGRPNAGPSSIDWVLGLKVKIVTTLDDIIVGRVYAYCTLTNTLTVLEDETPVGAKPDLKNYRILKVSFIKDLAVLEKDAGDASEDDAMTVNSQSSGPFLKATPRIGPVDINSAVQKINSAARAAGQLLAQRGVGVTKDAQDLFDALAKTLPVRWLDKSILVLEEVKVDPPYTAEACSAKTGSPALDRVKKVVDGERRRLETLKQARSETSEERKGG
ncbi:anticodon-binding domain-containing protein [Lipomyces tetrasporus]|uniref:Anticodon-binding domain-containing protein n=1 Tax=Lipomyces tetrasporus TaxID=54092 RepID=A0AAD7VV43_9ASCO|nr:anticodon-binding domain-containing protein [Lipomyces tetrasporus]KAJ8103867.1 anticodon-binding domain-containing protein [Lipomyces tetrasporus]